MDVTFSWKQRQVLWNILVNCYFQASGINVSTLMGILESGRSDCRVSADVYVTTSAIFTEFQALENRLLLLNIYSVALFIYRHSHRAKEPPKIWL